MRVQVLPVCQSCACGASFVEERSYRDVEAQGGIWMQCEGTRVGCGRCKNLTLVAQPEADHEGSGEKIALGMERQGGWGSKERVKRETCVG